jgi:Abortive infection alpha
MDLVTGAVVIAGLRHVGPPTAKVLSEFVSRVLAPVGDELGEAMADPVREYRRRRAQRAEALLLAAAEQLERTGVEAQPVPGRILMPILERGSLEEDDDLRARWVNLLATAATGADSVLPAFATILAELSPNEARLLAECYRDWSERQQPTAWSLVGNSTNLLQYTSAAGVIKADVSLIEDNLIRLRVLAPALPVLPSGAVDEVISDRQHYPRYERQSSSLRLEEIDAPIVTALGFAFMKAVMGPVEVG